jgi:hypothetical protein
VFTYLMTYEGALKRVFASDIFVVVNLVLFAFSCGYIATLGMNYGCDSTVSYRLSLNPLIYRIKIRH